ncbi:terminase large subunit [Streptomonospora salina]|uniref:Phage terminase large subunit-like protein n=1 Tax=Streptomonospora salina TaxID=104205 RepID=A0A841ECU8_9ACTN|nr:terminase TerL endonuclease subunit [Streptomonospora salina]MBB6000224.1 phage terminase large subunit-like protein [Streptomonospora salina]
MPARASRSRFPVCGRTFDGDTCTKRGEHYCQQRADHVVAFFSELLVHTKARWARQAFRLAPWQEHDIIRPLFGTVRWDEQAEQYVRRYRLAYISMARKCGKSEIAAGICLYLLCADGEEGAEIYGAAVDKDQARKVFDVAARMVKLSPVLSRRLVVKDHVKRIVDEQTGSYYEAIPADAGGNLGHNPHGAVYDELLTAPNGDLWNALRTGAGTRTQPLMVAITTAGNDRDSFCYQEYLEAKRVLENPNRAPHRFAYLAEAPPDADPWDEEVWKLANPALGDFLSIETLREEASEAREDPARENVFRQFRLNQWVSQVSRWVPMDLYDCAAGEPWPSPEWRLPVGRPLAYGGLDLSAKLDLTAWCVIVPRPDGGAEVLWRYWLPEAALPALVTSTGGAAESWVRDGWLTITEGDVIDYQRVYDDIAADAQRVTLAEIDYDPWSGEPAVQELGRRLGPSTELVPVPQTFTGLSPGMRELMAVLKTRAFDHHANPVSRHCFDAVEVKRGTDDPELIKPVKPRRGGANKRIDGVLTAAMAVAAWRTRARQEHRPGRVVGF